MKKITGDEQAVIDALNVIGGNVLTIFKGNSLLTSTLHPSGFLIKGNITDQETGRRLGFKSEKYRYYLFTIEGDYFG